MGSTVSAVLVVIPALDEEELVGRCVASVLEASRVARHRHPGLVVRVVVVADSCTDATAQRARDAGTVDVLEVTAGRVGHARAAGIDRGLALIGLPDAAVWIANTDADSVVPSNWIAEQLRIARRSIDVMIGTVTPDFDDLSPAQSRAWLARRVPGVPNGHVHGANLGIRASTYRAAGGFADLAEHEDIDLVTRCRRMAEAAIVASNRADVLTSGRQIGRTPGGYAGYLRTSLVEDETAP